MQLEYQTSGLALGTTIIHLSMLLDSRHPVILHAPENYTVLRDLKRICNIPDNQLIIKTQEHITDDLWRKCGDQGKFFSPYFNVNHVTLFGQDRPVGRRGKPAVGLATWDLQYEFENNLFPYNRLYPREYWAKVFTLIQSAGYDIITFNMLDVNLEQKIWMLNELCNCVIGYEGGICHLAHVLQIPTIILPWHCYGDGTIGGEGLWYFPQKIQIDPLSWFLKDSKELLSWNNTQFKNIINKLYDKQGNNVYYSDQLNINSDTLQIFSTTAPHIPLNPILTEFERNFIQDYISNRIPGGKRIIKNI